MGTLRVQGQMREFAVGDVAGKGFPATAQVAMQQADYCAWNIYASIRGKTLLEFKYQHLGNLMALGNLEGAATLNPRSGGLDAQRPARQCSQEGCLHLPNANK